MSEHLNQRHTIPLIIPYIRQAVLAGIEPIPDKLGAVRLGKLMAKSWIQFLDEYKLVVANSALVEINNLKPIETEKPRGRWEGNTWIIDFPRLQYIEGGKPVFDTRICAAFCTGGMSSKFWSRVFPTIYRSRIRYSMPLHEIEELSAQYHSITQKSSDWLFDKAKSILNNNVRNITKQGYLEVSSFGARDESLRGYFEKLLEIDVTLADILKDEEANNRLSFYFNKICNSSYNLRSLITQSESKDVLMFTSPIAIKTKDRHIKIREVLYMMRPINGKAQTIGLAYDDSEIGDLSLKSANRVASIMGWWI